MTDFEFYKKEASQNGKVRSFGKKKGGSKSKKCSLPTDHMTNKQIERMNGPMSTYNLNAPMKWETFKYMPRDLQREYIQKLKDKYNANFVAFSVMFGITSDSIRKYLHLHGMGDLVDKHMMSKDEKERWNVFTNNMVSSMPTLPVEETKKPEKIAEIPAAERVIKEKPVAAEMHGNITRSFRVCVDGKIDTQKVTSMLEAFLALCPEGYLEISYTSGKERP